MFVAKLDRDGGPLWSLGAGDPSYQRGTSVAVDRSDQILVAGEFEGTVDFGAGPLEPWEYDVFLAKFARTAADVVPAGPDTEPTLQSLPNPFNPRTTITYTVPTTGFVSLGVYDARGRRISTLVAEPKVAGEYAVPWDGRDIRGRAVGAGVYFLRLEAAGMAQAIKIVAVN